MEGGQLGLKNSGDELETRGGLGVRDVFGGFSDYTQSGARKHKGGVAGSWSSRSSSAPSCSLRRITW